MKMEIDRLVDLITKEVMTRLNELNKNAQYNKKRFLVVDYKENESFNLIESRVNENDIIIDSIDNMEGLDSYDGVILTGLDNKELANLALGVQCSKKEEIVIDSILRGMSIYLIKEGIKYRKYLNTSNREFFRLYEQYEKKISGYGIRIIDLKDLYESICCENEKKLKKADQSKNKELTTEANDGKKNIEVEYFDEHIKANKIDFRNKRLISEIDLRNVYKNGIKILEISKKTVITPLAQDFIRVNHMSVVRV